MAANSLLAGRGDVYNSSPLIHSKWAVRLLRVFDGAPGCPIQCHLETFELDSAPAYVALSYTWGSEKSTKHDIKIDGASFKIRRNLWTYLTQLIQIQQNSQSHMLEWLWVDAICINQDDNVEKDHQLPLMRDIYEQATLVEVWLGESIDRSDEAMLYLNSRVQRRLKKKSSVYVPPWSKSVANALLMLCNRNYWRRIWIVQETLYAPDIDVLCGSCRVPWTALEAFHGVLTIFKSQPRAEHYVQEARMLSSPCVELVATKMSWTADYAEDRPLKSLVHMYRDFACSDPRDRIFALLGLVHPRPWSFPHSYACSARDVYDAVLDLAYGSRAEWMQYVDGVSPRYREPHFRDVSRYSQDVSEVLRILDPIEESMAATRDSNTIWGERFGLDWTKHPSPQQSESLSLTPGATRFQRRQINSPTIPRTAFNNFASTTPVAEPSAVYSSPYYRQTAPTSLQSSSSQANTTASQAVNQRSTHNAEQPLQGLFLERGRSASPQRFFVTGRVLTLSTSLYSERKSAETAPDLVRTSPLLGTTGEIEGRGMRAFIVVHQGVDCCSCLPITTYKGRGIAEPGHKQSDYSVVHTSQQAPAEFLSQGESLLQYAIRVCADDPQDNLPVTAHLNYLEVHTIQHDVKVRNFGRVLNAGAARAILHPLART